MVSKHMKTLNDFFNQEYGIDKSLFKKNPKELINSPFLFRNMKRHIHLLYNSYQSKKHILYLVDTDVDGITSATLMLSYFKKIFPKVNVSFKVNENKRHGVFLDYKEINSLKKGDTLIVNDAGSNDIDKIEILLKKGISVIITDHHDIEKENINRIKQLLKQYSNYSIISPQLENFECHMTGSGMAHKVITAFDNEFGYDFSDNYFDLAVTGIIADMESFDAEVLGYLKKGLNHFENLELKEILYHKKNSLDNISAKDISFFVSPMINSVFRLGNNTQRKFIMKCFLTNRYLKKEFPHQLEEEEVHDFSIRLLNKLKEEQNKNIEEAISQAKIIERKLLIVIISEKYKNLTGLIANKLTNDYRKPCLVVWKKKDECIATGSARSCIEYDMKQSLLDTGLFEYCAGHEQAFGLGFHKDNLSKISKISVPDIENKIQYHFEFDFNHLDTDILFETCNYNQYYMRGFEAPNFKINNIKVNKIQHIGKNGIKLIGNNISFLMFNKPDIQWDDNGIYSIIGKVEINDYNGKRNLQFICEDISIQK